MAAAAEAAVADAADAADDFHETHPRYEIYQILKKTKIDKFDSRSVFNIHATSAKCVCGANQWTYSSAQIRSADEGETSFKQCGSCSRVIRL